MRPKIIHFSRFLSAGIVHGGVNRSRQIAELLSGFDLSNLPGLRAGALELPKDLIAALRAVVSTRPERRTTKAFLEMYRTGAGIRRNNIDLVITEEMYWSPEVLKLCGKARVVSIPQNIESLVPGNGQGSIEQRARDVTKELKGIAGARACFAICPEDAAIAAAFNPKTFVLPYFPPESQFGSLQQIRKKRDIFRDRGQCGDFVLVLGSVTNEPTRRGVQALIENLELKTPPQRFVIAGNGTEVFHRNANSNIKVLGRVSEIELDQLLVEASCLFVNHHPSTGCLTRNIDALVAGIPIVSNRYGARGAAGFAGVHVFSDLSESYDMIRELPSELPSEPRRPHSDEEFFRHTLMTLASNDHNGDAAS
jgi:hypothetical protein